MAMTVGWKVGGETPLTEEQWRLVLDYTPLAKNRAARWAHRSGHSYLRDDFERIILVHLERAAREFNPSRGKFSGLVMKRVLDAHRACNAFLTKHIRVGCVLRTQRHRTAPNGSPVWERSDIHEGHRGLDMIHSMVDRRGDTRGYSSEDLWHDFESALARMKPQTAVAARLHHREGLTQAEVAARMGTSQSSVCKHLERAHGILRSVFRAGCFPEDQEAARRPA